jgi:HlyD family secretion protein
VATEQLRLARRLADRLVVRAPASGTVTSLLTERGSAVDATTPLARVQDLSHLVVNVALTEFDVSRTTIGAATRIGADALGGQQFTGKVIDVALTGTDSGGVVTFPVIMSIDEPTGLRPGMSVSARVVTASVADAVRLPLDAIEDQEGRRATVSVRTRSGDVEEREVRLGLVGGAYAEVRSGLRVGEKVVLPAPDES